MYNGAFVFKQHYQRLGSRITLYCPVIQNYRGWMCEKSYLESAYVFNLLRSSPPKAKRNNFKRSKNANYINKGNIEDN